MYKSFFGKKNKELVSLLLCSMLLSGCADLDISLDSSAKGKDDSKTASTEETSEEEKDKDKNKDSGKDAASKDDSSESDESVAEASKVEDEDAKSEELNIFADFPEMFYFSSGAGGWATEIVIAEDGSFTGSYYDYDMGDTGDGYPDGTLYICDFTGQFSDPEPTDKDYIYKTKLLDLVLLDEDKIGTQEIIDDTLYVYTDPYGFEGADEFIIYAPGADLSEMSDECLSWTFMSLDIFEQVPVDYYVLYNVNGEEAFNGICDDSIWNRSYRCTNGDAYVNFSPSYYMGSYFSFFPDDDSPASLSLSLPWDGVSSETMECKENWKTDGETYNVTIEKKDDETYIITVEGISDTTFDFSEWGGTEPGKFSGEFVLQQ